MVYSKRLSAMLVLAVCGLVCLSSAAAVTAAPVDAEATHDTADHGSPNPLGFDPDLAIFTAIIFLLLFYVLRKFAWKPIAAALEHREHAIESNIAKAEGAAAEARAMLADYEKKLAGASDEVRAMLEEARRDAEATKQEIVAEARVAARQEQDRALRDIGTAKDRALKELAEQSTNIAVDLAGKIVRAQLTKADHAALVQDAMSKFAAAKPSAN